MINTDMVFRVFENRDLGSFVAHFEAFRNDKRVFHWDETVNFQKFCAKKSENPCPY